MLHHAHAVPQNSVLFVGTTDGRRARSFLATAGRLVHATNLSSPLCYGSRTSWYYSNNVSLDLPLLTSAPSKKLITGIDFWHLMVRGILTIRLNRQVIPRKLRTVLERASLNLLASEVADEASPKVPLKESRSPILELFISLQAIQHGRE